MKVLCLSSNPELALLRSTLLRSEGMDVDYPQSREEAKRLIESGQYDVAIICHSLAAASAETFCQAFRAHNPGKCLIYIMKTPWQRPQIKADIYVSGIDGPERLVEAVRTCEVAG